MQNVTINCPRIFPTDSYLQNVTHKGQKAVVNTVVISLLIDYFKNIHLFQILKTTAWIMKYKLFLIFHVRKRLKLPFTDFVISSRNSTNFAQSQEV